MKSIWFTSPKPKKLTTNVIIIGGGISGLGLAYWLSRKKIKSVVIEKNTLASGATGRNAGFLSTGSLSLFNTMVKKYGLEKSMNMRKFYKRNHQLLKQELNLSPKKLDYKTSGSLSLMFDQQEENWCDLVSELNKEDFKLKYFSKEEVVNSTGVENTLGGFLDQDDGQIHSYKLVLEIKKILEKEGYCTILENEEVLELDDNSLITNNFQIQGKDIVLATNAYTSLILPNFKEFLFPIRGQMLALKGEEYFMKHNVYASKMLCYFRQLPTKEVIIGGFRTLDEKNEVGYSDETTDVIQTAFENFLKTYVPKTKDLKVSHRWAGTMGFSFDENPLVGEIKPHQYILGGYHGHGMGKAFACAEALSSLITQDSSLPDFIDVKRIFK